MEQERENPGYESETGSAAGYQERVDSTRESMGRTVRQIEEKISPGRILDDVLGDLRESFSRTRSPSRTLEETVGKNPTPFAAAGIGLLLLGAGLSAYSISRMRRQTQEASDGAAAPGTAQKEASIGAQEEPVQPPRPEESEIGAAAAAGEPRKYMCARCGYTADGKFEGDICPQCGLTYWKCSNCRYTITAAVPPATCPQCGEKCEYINITCYTPECGGPGHIDPRL